MVIAKWSGKYPNLCRGEWLLEIDGTDVSEYIPKEIRKQSMNTYGKYQKFYFDEKWLDYFEDYKDGLFEEEWIRANDFWLNEITNDIKTKREIFKAIQQCDFRELSCGGCI